MLKGNLIVFIGAIALMILLSGWGYTGHKTIARNAGVTVGEKIKGYDQWQPFIAHHSGDPDYRKFWVKAEAPKHYIDMDNYPEFKTAGYINPNIDSLTVKYGGEFITEQGTLPWATIAVFDSLTTCFKTRDFYNAKRWASDLSHYVGDGHMPLHITQNYDGADTGNKGIHLRYESKMISRYIDSIKTQSHSVTYVSNPSNYVFDYLYGSNRLCDSLFNADNKAKELAGSYDSPLYLDELWRNTSQLTNDQFSKASTAYANLVYTAWVNGGSPDLTGGMKPAIEKYDCEITTIEHTPNDSLMVVNYEIFIDGNYKMDVRTPDGGSLIKAGKWEKTKGSYSNTINVKILSKGNYLVVLDCANYASTVEFVIK